MAPAAVARLQQTAGIDWATGQERAGHHLNLIKAETLIADGSEDPYDAVDNSQALARQIPHSQLHIYPDATHGFWFQDRKDFVPRVDRFLH